MAHYEHHLWNQHSILFGIDTPFIPSAPPGQIENINGRVIAIDNGSDEIALQRVVQNINDRQIAVESQSPQTPHPPPEATYTQSTFVNKVREIFNEHEIDGVSSTDNEAVFTSIADMCQDLVDKRTQMRQYQHEFTHLVSRLKRENTKLKEKNNELEHQLFLTNINILEQSHEYLAQLVNELAAYDAKDAEGHNVYSHFKIKLQGMHESLSDLAHDLNEKELHSAVHKLKKGIEAIEFVQHHGLYKHNHLHNILHGLTKEFVDIPKHGETPGGPGSNDDAKEENESEDEKKEKEDNENENENEIDALLAKHGVFEEECPCVIRIDIDGGWFNKKTRAMIKYRGKVFGRKEADFKWLYKMLQCDFNWLGSEEPENESDDTIPDFNKELPHTMWHDNYLTKRKRELNLFLMQCHLLKNLTSDTPYDPSDPYHIFLEPDKEKWKSKRNEFDQIMLERIKQTGH